MSAFQNQANYLAYLDQKDLKELVTLSDSSSKDEEELECLIKILYKMLNIICNKT